MSTAADDPTPPEEPTPDGNDAAVFIDPAWAKGEDLVTPKVSTPRALPTDARFLAVHAFCKKCGHIALQHSGSYRKHATQLGGACEALSTDAIRRLPDGSYPHPKFHWGHCGCVRFIPVSLRPWWKFWARP